jgi:signal transduction histidine kinase
MTTSCEHCVFDRMADLTSDALVAGVERCGACPRLADPLVRDLVARLRSAVRPREPDPDDSKTVVLRLLSRIASVANAAADADEMLRLCLPPLCEATGSVAGFVAQGDQVGARSLVDGARAAVDAALLRLAGCGWVGELHRAAEPTWLSVADAGPDVVAAVGDAGIGRLIGIPVLVGDATVTCCVLVGDGATNEAGLADVVAAAQGALAAQLGLVLARQRAAEAIARARDAAEAASRAKSDFVAGISHELRTPLSAILGYGELLAEDFVERGETDAVAVITRMNGASRHLLGLINNVLDLSKIEANKMEVVREPIDIEELVSDVVETLTPMVEDRGNRLLLRGARLERPLMSDPTKIRQLLFNLIGNAAKFTRMGTITVGVVLAADSAGGMTLHLSVEDSGIGMSEAQLARIFEAFTQADVTIATRFGGTGLGLTLCKRLADLLGGTIHVVSKPGAGSRFSVDLPVVFAEESLASES